jgi:hypothetical protein
VQDNAFIPEHNDNPGEMVEAVDIVDVTQMVELMKMQRLAVIFIGCSC